ncbi:DNA mismatch repair protein MutS domain-containing protein [Clostridium bornimense]|uniref:DNA mismatch repair protein MutS domain-containing protein n=1 Tax=Clostridium bornimense TaxID=1216932 RepID=W6RTK3_9CLOT|nr:mannonate oxidoreductase [Clostridium bornimense]CDM67623.1 DNA mismatch repair protein MutS domain-containing protein [Clostridium bornimense]
MNNDTMEKLNYNKLKEMVKSYCSSSLGRNLIDKLQPSSSIKEVQRRLSETTEGRCLLDADYYIPLEGISNVTVLIDKIDKNGVLDPSELISISDFLRGCRKIKGFMKNKEGYAPTLSAYGENISELCEVEENINNAIKGSGIDTNASKELKKIRKQIDICEGRIDERLNKFLRNPNNKEYIQDFFISKRNDKYTIPIKAQYKNYVKGVLVDTSAKGGTVFIEPEAISKYTSELAMLKAEESIEEYRILSILTEEIYNYIKEIKINVEVIAEYDMIFAKAKYSKAIDGIMPKVNDCGYTKINKGRYPFIENSVPLDYEIGKDYRTLIITGPNAGGKTVVLKTIGVLTLATESGFHIAADDGTEISIFDNIFVDIGDNQSVENSLSTFSSHVKNLADILKRTNNSTLLLFDEIGSGTEPNEGAALAIAMLEEFYYKGAITIASTHYGEIKNFSREHPDFENAAMDFEKETLEPLYKLSIGKSGNSNALYISKKMGIPDFIIEKTKCYIENKEYSYNLIKESKKKTIIEKIKEESINHYNVGDKVLLLDKGESAIVYKGMDRFNNITVLYKKEFLEVNYKRVKLEIKREDLYPEDYDMEQLFVDFKTRKIKKDIERGSKKALNEIKKGHMK